MSFTFIVTQIAIALFLVVRSLSVQSSHCLVIVRGAIALFFGSAIAIRPIITLFGNCKRCDRVSFDGAIAIRPIIALSW
ncbi:hypothetical protein [Coleofasciculus sp. H7-2]|uniref:hypothetical protein n=1 Tax=Coleofasciculus sp. H7-2 TaxID=3351545 RepID=UPI00366CC3AA